MGATAFKNGLLGLQSETTSSATTSYTRYPYGNLVSQRKSGGNEYYLIDGLGSVVGLTNSSGTLIQRFNYDPYGKLISTANVSHLLEVRTKY